LQNKSNQKRLKTGKWIQTETSLNIKSVATGRYKKGKNWNLEEFMNDRLLSKKI
jgi:hypothetical protein